MQINAYKLGIINFRRATRSTSHVKIEKYISKHFKDERGRNV